MDDRAGIDHRLTALIAGFALIGVLLLGGGPGAADAGAKGKKIRACVTKRGPDKGAMRFSRSGKCQKGEKKISWKKKGKAGPQGATGETGPQGPSGVTEELLETITTQQQTIETLTTQVASLTAQLNAVKAQTAALCAQMTPVAGRINALIDVIEGISLGGIIPVGLLLDVPDPPNPLSAFSCPAP